VTKQELSSTDYVQIDQWIQEQQLVYLELFDGNYLIYDSMYDPDEQGIYYEIDLNYEDWGNVYSVTFADKTVIACISGFYDYQLYNTIQTVNLVLSFSVFWLLLLLGIRSKLQYIQQLQQEIDILKGGGLEHPITISGHDELSDLAKGLEAMRCSIQQQMEQEAYLRTANQTMITELSHDLRTPLTSILLYTEILQTKFPLEPQQQDYLDKIMKKVAHIRNLSDRLLEYSLSNQPRTVPLLPPQTVKAIFYDELSELCCYLECQGFRVETELRWEPAAIRVNEELISRIVNNVASNMRKYADTSAPVTIRTAYSPRTFTLTFENTQLPTTSTAESSCIGIQSICNMMEQMGGQCKVVQTGAQFSLVLRFCRESVLPN
jgi:signal transduction histidine kinase